MGKLTGLKKFLLCSRSAAIDEDDPRAVSICDTNEDSNISNSNHITGPYEACDGVERVQPHGSCPRYHHHQTAGEQHPSNGNNDTSENTNNKMISSFVSVIEGTKDLAINEEKQRSPKHTKSPTAASQTQQQQPRNLVNVSANMLSKLLLILTDFQNSFSPFMQNVYRNHKLRSGSVP